MPTIISGDGTITGLTATGISAVQNLPAGSVLQVVNASYGTIAVSNTATYADTGLTATITPKFATSKILVIVSQNGLGKATNQQISLRLFRGATNILQMGEDDGNTGTTLTLYFGSVSTSFLDSPATTSATTYKTQFRTPSGGAEVYCQVGSARSTITLMEIAV